MSFFKTMQSALQKALPTRESLAQHAWLRPVAHHLLHPQLWRLQHESVARGVAIGTFWAFVIPLGQTFAAAAHCTWWRGNIPAAAVMTMLTNPLTFGFWLWLAYPVGSLVLGMPVSVSAQALADTGWAHSLQEIGGPVLLGMGIFGVGGAALGYLLVKLGWRLRVALRRHQSNAGA
jgi:uncharacterized protein (DUF2062 family)